MFKVFIYMTGVILTSIGSFFTIIYLNLFSMGYSFFEFVKFISMKVECLLLIIGIILIIVSLERWIKDELLLRRNIKLERTRCI